MSQWKKLVLLFVLLFIVDHVFGQGCSQCKMLAEQASGHGGGEVTESSFGTNLNTGILYLMAIPYILLTLLLGYFLRKPIIAFFKGQTGKKVA